MKTRTAYIETPDDFLPSIRIDDAMFVRASFMRLDDKMYRVSVWGADDFGFEFDTVDHDAALWMWDRVKSSDVIRINSLVEAGFVRA